MVLNNFTYFICFYCKHMIYTNELHRSLEGSFMDMCTMSRNRTWSMFHAFIITSPNQSSFCWARDLCRASQPFSNALLNRFLQRKRNIGCSAIPGEIVRVQIERHYTWNNGDTDLIMNPSTTQVSCSWDISYHRISAISTSSFIIILQVNQFGINRRQSRSLMERFVTKTQVNGILSHTKLPS